MASELSVDYRTISRIEKGRYKPKTGTFQKIKEYLDINRDICSTHLVVEDFELLELERDVSREIFFRRYERAEKLYIKLKNKLSLENKENKQYIMYRDAMFDVLNKKITKEQAIKRCKEAFRITRKNCKIEDLSNIVLNRNEVMIITYIAKIYSELGNIEKSIYIFEQVLKGFQNSKVDLKYHYVSVSLLYEYLSAKYEENNQFDMALEFCEKGILFELRCERGSSLGYYVMQKIYTQERKNKKKEEHQFYYKQAYQLLKLMKIESSMKELQNFYDSNYKDSIY